MISYHKGEHVNAFMFIIFWSGQSLVFYSFFKVIHLWLELEALIKKSLITDLQGVSKTSYTHFWCRVTIFHFRTSCILLNTISHK